jgi:hypothetical protein
MKRRTKFACLTLVMAFAMASTATSAQALTWVVKGKILTPNEFHEVHCHQAEPFLIEGEAGGAEVDLEFAKVECQEWVIWNTMEQAYSTGKLALTEGKVLGALGKNCEVENGMVTTELLTGHAGEFPKLPAKFGVTYKPVVGETIAIIHFKSIKGKVCALNGINVPLKGMDVAEVPELGEGVLPYKFSFEIEEIVGERLIFGEEPASLDGIIHFEF